MGQPVKHLPSVEYLRECFDYDPSTGVLMWKERPREHFPTTKAWRRWVTNYAGRVAGWLGKGYYHVSIGRNNHKTHRIVWKLATGEEPPAMLDHRDGNRANNCFANLREANHCEQSRNRGLRKDNVSGRRGVSLQNGKWKSSIYIDGVKRHLGYFATVEEASVAYETIASEAYGKFYRQLKEI